MIIERAELLLVRLPMIRSFATSSSQKTHQAHILVKLYADGLVGWGECPSPTDPYYCEETTETCWHMLRDFLLPGIVGKAWASAEDVQATYAKLKRNNFAKAGLEMACWDLLAQRAGRPLHAMLGGTRDEVLSGVSLGVEQDTGRLIGLVEQYLGEGYRRIKLKIGPGRDVAVIAAVRERFPDVPLMADANSAYTLADLPMLKELDQFGLMMIEQPLAHDDIVDHATLQAELSTPICLDESIHSVEDARKALDLGSGRIINIKVSRLGGLLNAKRVHDHCLARGVPVWCGGMHEFGVGRAANLAIASLPGFSIPGDVSGSDKYYHEDIVEPAILAERGAIPLPSGPGLGYTVDERRVERACERRLALR
ncbi:o-succinylbenzoate synthase [Oscillochloris sp. ZM17-4]|uniref:o-succinylbenzoate synthase n=1 Tax=Oscillochloris sp. ZM17-4 TaxID=2866714 RepID=UPI001C730BB1|nr:o-succinylbenzoate synthase [Oscillochloris sp. ZM17-4]